MKKYGRAEVQLHSFLTLLLDGDERSASRPLCFATGKGTDLTSWMEKNV
jgi:hypothetical protein